MSVSYGGDSITFADSSVQSSGWTGMRNRIINGAMTINQRSYSGSPANGDYTVDRFYGVASASSKYTVAQSSTAPAGFINSLLATSSSAYSLGAGDLFGITQRIEGLNVGDLAWGTASAATVTLSFWVRSSLTGTFGGSLSNSASTRSYPFSYTISSANTWEQKSVTIAGDTSGTWLTTNGVGIAVNFSIGTGTTYSGTAGTWSGSYYYSVTSATSVVGTNGATFYITGVQFERGSAASSFEYRPYTTELQLCQRYYEKGGISTRSGNRSNGTSQTIQAYYKVQKRDIPTFAVSGGYTADGWGTYNIGAHDNPSGANDRLNWGNLEAIATSAVGSSGVIACVWTSIAEL